MDPQPITDETLDRMAAAVGLGIDPAYCAGVAAALARLLSLGGLVGAAVEDGDPAPVYDP